MLPLLFEKDWPLLQALVSLNRGSASCSMHSWVRQPFGSGRHSEVKNRVSSPSIFEARQYCDPESHSSALQRNFTDGPEKLAPPLLAVGFVSFDSPGAALDSGALAAEGLSFLSRPQLAVASNEALAVMKSNDRIMCSTPIVLEIGPSNTVVLHLKQQYSRRIRVGLAILSIHERDLWVQGLCSQGDY
jgi:hypothetical protein